MRRASITTMLMFAGLLGCGASSSSPGYGTEHVQPERVPFDLPLMGADGEPVDLADYRGRRLLLALFTTFDLASQAAFQPVREVATDMPNLAVVGIALQPNPGELLPIFASALSLDFPLAYETENRLLPGLTELGKIESVPSYVLIDEQGFVIRKHTGGMNTTTLQAWCAAP